MTVTRVPACNPEPEGLDGRGTMHAADLPATAHTWGHLSVSLETDTDLDADVPVKRSLCLLVDPEGDYVMPGRCKKPRGHEGACDWGATHGAFLGDAARWGLVREGQQQTPASRGMDPLPDDETPSGRLPVRERWTV